MRLQVSVLHPRHVDRTNLGQINCPVAVHDYRLVRLNLTPQTDQELVTRADRIVRGDRHVLNRHHPVRGVLKDVVAEHLHVTVGRLFNKLLKLVLDPGLALNQRQGVLTLIRLLIVSSVVGLRHHLLRDYQLLILVIKI